MVGAERTPHARERGVPLRVAHPAWAAAGWRRRRVGQGDKWRDLRLGVKPRVHRRSVDAGAPGRLLLRH